MAGRTCSIAARLLLLTVAIAGAACETTPEAASAARIEAMGTAPITHVILIRLKDPTRIAELVADCNAALPRIEAVAGYSCGVPLVTDRASVLSDYDVGLYVGFRTEADYKAYLDDPRHLELVARWKEAWKGVTIYDIVESVAPASAVALPPRATSGAAGAASGRATGEGDAAAAPARPATDRPTPARESAPTAPPSAGGAPSARP